MSSRVFESHKGSGPEKPAKGRRRTPKFRRRAGARPDEVLDAALALFMEKGFAATRVEDIAKRAGISKGAVYLYFSSKEAVFEGLVRRAIVPIAANAMDMAGHMDGDPRAALSAMMNLLASRISDPRVSAIPRLIMREAMQFPSLAQMYRREVLDRAMPVLVMLIEKGIAGGYLRPVDPELTIRSVVGPVLTHLLLDEVFDVHPEGGLQMERLLDNHLTILFEGLSVTKGRAQ